MATLRNHPNTRQRRRMLAGVLWGAVHCWLRILRQVVLALADDRYWWPACRGNKRSPARVATPTWTMHPFHVCRTVHPLRESWQLCWELCRTLTVNKVSLRCLMMRRLTVSMVYSCRLAHLQMTERSRWLKINQGCGLWSLTKADIQGIHSLSPALRWQAVRLRESDRS
jgi:hypothetical protein